MPRLIVYLLLPLFAALAGCDQIASLDGSKAREADGVAVGSACRQAGRAIEDCFNMNPEAPKASVFAGWKEMNDYMVQNKLESVTPQVPRPKAKEEVKEEVKPEAKEEVKPEAKEEAKKKEESSKEEGRVAEKPAAKPEAAPAAPGMPVVPATVNIPGLNTPTTAAPAAAPAKPAASAAAPAASSIAVGGQNIPISMPGSPPSIVPPATPAQAGAAPTKH